MRSSVRAALAAAAVLATGLSLHPAQAGAQVLDGKKVKNLHLVFEAPPGATTTDPTPQQVASCKPPQCARLSFVYKPAKGVKAPLSVVSRNFWNVLGDDDLYLLKGSQVLASCTGFTSNYRYLTVPAKALKPGTTYTAVLFVSHEIGETTAIDVDLPGRAAPAEKASVDATKPFPEQQVTSCGT